jgi:hypothetical protein
MDTWQITFAILMGFSLAATCGLRAFLPLFIIALASRAGFVALAPSFMWMQSNAALICFGSAAILEILGDKIPVVDHVLDAGAVVIRPIAGAIAATSLIRGLDPLAAIVIGIIVGSSIAGYIHSVKSTVRLISTSTTAGTVNPVISFIEDAATIVGSILGLVIPYLTALAIIIILFLLGKMVISKFRKSKQSNPTACS